MKQRSELLSRAKEHSAEVVLVQETGTTMHQLPGMYSFFKRQGWQMLACPAKCLPSGGKGGVAVLAKEPLALSSVKETTLDSGQLLVCRLHGASMPLDIGCIYRRPAAPEDIILELETHLAQPSRVNSGFRS